MNDENLHVLEINIEFMKYRSFLFLENYIKQFKDIHVSYNAETL